ncbi:MAG: ABC transporter ATP-binding protein [Pseudomonadota bacterium]|nr:MAG: ABC transporter ATP-binding protein [Pseudomonadota bacterium]
MSGLTVSALRVRARGRAILSDLSFELGAGELLALVGPNGAGKTTLLRTVLGLVRPESGSVHVAGRPLEALSARERAAELAWLPQARVIADPVPALEVVAAARYRFRESRRASETKARAALERLGIGHFAERPITELSGGERQRVLLAALMAQEARIVLLDEPGSHLDPAQQLDVYRLIGALWRSGLGVVVVTHDINLLGELGAADRVRVLGLARGRAAFQTTLADPELPERLGALFGVEFVAVSAGPRRVLVPVSRTEERTP